MNADNLDSACRIISMVSEHMLVGGAHKELLAYLEEVLARNPEHIEALRVMIRYHSWLKEENEVVRSLERLAEVARLNESDDDERFALSELIKLVPHETQFIERLKEINGGVDPETVGADKAIPEYGSYEALSSDDDEGEAVEEVVEVTEIGYELEGSEGSVPVETEPVEASVVEESSQESVSPVDAVEMDANERVSPVDAVEIDPNAELSPVEAIENAMEPQGELSPVEAIAASLDDDPVAGPEADTATGMDEAHADEKETVAPESEIDPDALNSRGCSRR